MTKIEYDKEQLRLYNLAYRMGKAKISDQEFDSKLENLKIQISEKEFNDFINTLHEKTGKIEHPFVMGSLDKIKFGENDILNEFLNKYIKNEKLNISAKIDGISCRLHYFNGELNLAATRGDGYKGESLTDKILYVKGVPKNLFGHNIEVFKTFDVRGELVILKDDFNEMSGFSNPRNACAGIMNRKEFNPDDIKHISFIAYSVLNLNLSKENQFEILKKYGFNTAWNLNINWQDFDKIQNKLFEYASQNYSYETDGLVLCSSNYRNEDKYRPDACKAFKINQLVGQSRIIDIEWQGPSKDGKFWPIAIIEPIELGGSIISKATLNNIDFIQKLGIEYGSYVEICKAGDIIPTILKVIKK